MRPLTRYVLVFIRLYLGAWMLLNGVNHFLPIFPQPMGGAMKSVQLLETLIETGLFDVVKSVEILVGVMLLLDLFVPVALVIAMPVSVVVYFNALVGGRPFPLSMALGCLVWNAVLLLAYLRHYLPMLRIDARMGTLADLGGLTGICRREKAAIATPESRHRSLIAGTGLLLTAALAYYLHPFGPQPAGSGKTSAEIVRDYLNLAYRDGKPGEAAALYLSPEMARTESLGDRRPANHPQDVEILSVVEQGPDVAVYYRIAMPPDPAVDVVDIYQVAKSRIAARVRISSPARRLTTGDFRAARG